MLLFKFPQEKHFPSELAASLNPEGIFGKDPVCPGCHQPWVLRTFAGRSSTRCLEQLLMRPETGRIMVFVKEEWCGGGGCTYDKSGLFECSTKGRFSTLLIILMQLLWTLSNVYKSRRMLIIGEFREESQERLKDWKPYLIVNDSRSSIC